MRASGGMRSPGFLCAFGQGLSSLNAGSFPCKMEVTTVLGEKRRGFIYPAQSLARHLMFNQHRDGYLHTESENGVQQVVWLVTHTDWLSWGWTPGLGPELALSQDKPDPGLAVGRSS